ncbi:MAG: KEOPS complex subunit Pcc1 [Nitrososphaerota archaeon]|nr:KEOPS complex subunit Pcc1 [Candidatus Bathyarchaeota archaeon]MCX8162207.1 KEOPS complex subunit Pcc1 [Candidatus Bathyarchaeota archaeon]MDW8062226.1 KEOPS complex subunit Pcc1 [Nitrososphaerota archaeon]
MDGKANADIKMNLGKTEINSIVYLSLRPEARSLPSRRIESKIRLDSVIMIEIRASDTTALRAVVNSYIRLIRAAKAAVDLVDLHPY